MRLRRYGSVVFICMAGLCLTFSQERVSTHKIYPLARTLELSHAEYIDRVQPTWTAQMTAQLTDLHFEHQPASVLRDTPLSHPPGHAPVDDDYYYEMVAIRAFEKYGIGMTVQQLGRQWLENNAGQANGAGS